MRKDLSRKINTSSEAAKIAQSDQVASSTPAKQMSASNTTKSNDQNSSSMTDKNRKNLNVLHLLMENTNKKNPIRTDERTALLPYTIHFFMIKQVFEKENSHLKVLNMFANNSMKYPFSNIDQR